METGIEFVGRVCPNTCFYHKGQRIKLEIPKNTDVYSNISYHSTEKLKLNLYVFRDVRHKEPLYLISNSGQNTQLYRTYMVNFEIKDAHFCPSDLRIATKLTGSRESEFPRTTQNVLLW